MSVRQKKILALEPYYGGSHKNFIDNLIENSCHNWTLMTESPHHWKWRMRTSCFFFANKLKKKEHSIDCIFTSSYLDLACFLALQPQLHSTKKIIYFHENQLTYPVQEHKERDNHFTMTHLSSMLVADKILFNSHWHLQSFTSALRKFCKLIPNIDETYYLSSLKKSEVLHLAISDDCFNNFISEKKSGPIKIVWNHRYEFDKGVDVFIEVLNSLQNNRVSFDLILLGEKKEASKNFYLKKIKSLFSKNIIFSKDISNRTEYLSILAKGDVCISTSRHEFFGISILEAICLGCVPILPNSLSYPELVPNLIKFGVFYSDEDDLMQKISFYSRFLNQIRSEDYTLALRKYIQKKYSWSHKAFQFDEKINSLVT